MLWTAAVLIDFMAFAPLAIRLGVQPWRDGGRNERW
jgi:hypothetical protein